jgi:hypothetical protein
MLKTGFTKPLYTHKINLINTFLIILSFIFTTSLFTQDFSIAVSFVNGETYLVRKGKKQLLKPKTMLAKDDEIQTENGIADLQLGTEAIFRINKNTKILIKNLVSSENKKSVSIFLEIGELFAKINKIKDGNKTMEFNSPSINAGVRGTEFLFSEKSTELENDNAPSGLFLKEGEVEVSNSRKLEQTEILKAGEEVLVTSNGLKKGIIEAYLKEKMEILNTLVIQKDLNNKSLNEMKNKNQDLYRK